MGSTCISIHIYSGQPISALDLRFDAFSDGWQTCVEDFAEKDRDWIVEAARSLSRQVDAPVLLFSVFDSKSIQFDLYRDGKRTASYADYEFLPNKKLYSIPAMVGYRDDGKRRLSHILACADVEDKIAMLEEYFGVCLIPLADLFGEPELLHRMRGDTLYRAHMEQEKRLTGKQAPITAELIAQYNGKLFLDYFGRHTQKAHCFLLGYDTDSPNLRPIRFTGDSLTEITAEEFETERLARSQQLDACCTLEYGTTCKAVFNAQAPLHYAGKTMSLPSGCYPVDFDSRGRLLLEGLHRILVVDERMQLIAKLPICGEIADVIDDYILTCSEGSFYAYEYDPKARICIYQLRDKRLHERSGQ